MRLPNRFGSVFRLSDHKHRRKPYCARVTSGYNAKNQPLYTVVGYYSSRADGIAALSEWHKEPVISQDMAFGEAAKKAFEREKNHLADSTLTIYRNAYNKYLSDIAKMKVSAVRIEHIQQIIDNIEKVTMQAAVRTSYRIIERYCLKFNLISKGFADLLEVRKYEKKAVRVCFTQEEISRIWADVSEEINQAALILLYTGMRIEELRKLKVSQINIRDKIITCGSKTQAGKNRIIPIHPRIDNIVICLAKRKVETDDILPMPNFRKDWERLCVRLGVRHVPHECRHTFRTELDKNGANKVCIDRLMGHVSMSVGDRVYTHKTLDELRETILKVTY